MAETLNVPSEKAGLPPGSLVHVGRSPAVAGRVVLISFSEEHFIEQQVASLDDILAHRQPGATLWVHCEGLDIVELLEAIGLHLSVHPLVLEDILNTHQRPKFEEYEDYLFLVMKTLRGDSSLTVGHEQISLLLFADMLFTFRENADDLFGNLRQRLAHPKGRIRSRGADYLAYVVMDAVVDNYFALSDTVEEAIERAEITLLDRPQSTTFVFIQRLKRELVFVRKAITPLREVLLAIQRSENPLIHEKTQLYFRDVFDHTLRVIDTMDSHRDLINGMLDIYLSSVSNRMNEIMKVLTVFATIFIPLTFLVGIYGMNFDHMPELHWKWSYPVLWGLFFLIPAVLLAVFRKKKWL
ncbi:magnesium and cobalt transport protein CorA [Desulfobulbus propionicus DSM 2032]|jgi:magnesium transporter|uniref:Magnesium transport protein CorA n=1 Tax=Desulfobulbus propionicus (strain ATCC 33891 / DSM 2032 / VKM B-1956 / 1pr3) TaxID=577650 RepID=A0A7U3YLP2_DESPD|nr:magnesium/cobalt transporter CorA [Desulfobulbus propionicus]ADW17680.1 magnesium and cobalt transport protein CorA [Desulfobulbus propionicus DSM 2032]